METNSFTLEVAYTKIESNIKINGLLFDPLTPSGANCPSSYTILRLRYLQISLMLIKGLKEYKKETMRLK